MSNLVCPVCGSSNIQTERRPDGFRHCIDCRYSWAIGGLQQKPTLFHQITQSPEVLAEMLVYQTADEFGDVTWSSTIVPGWYVGREDCIAATVAKLKEVAG